MYCAGGSTERKRTLKLKSNVKFALAYNGLHGQEPQTFAKLAEVLGVDRGNLSRFLSGKKGGAALTIEQVAEALGTTVTKLVTGNL